MTGAWTRWVERVEAREPVVALAAFRAAIGLVIAWTLVRVWVSGAHAALWHPVAEGGVLELSGDWRVAALGGPSAALSDGLLGVALVGAGLVAAGLGTRVAALVTGQALLALLSLVPESGGGHDRLLTNALWLLVLAPSDASWSLACRLRTGAWVDPTPRPSIVRRLAMWQLTIAYTVTGWQKLGPEWWPWGGLSAVYRSLLQPEWGKHDLTWIASVFPATQVMTAVTMVWECGFPLVLVWMGARHRWPALRRVDVRALFLIVGLAVHGTLQAALNLGPFAFVTVAFYVCFFDADELDALRARLRPVRTT